VGSQDYDSLLLGAPRLVKGLTLSGTLELSIIHLDKALGELGISQEQLIDLAVLVGTDFNDGVKGIGPKKALKIVREGKVGEVSANVDFDFEEVRNLFLHPQVSDEYSVEWKKPDRDGIIRLLCEEHDFSEERVNTAIGNLEKSLKEFSQKDLSAWF